MSKFLTFKNQAAGKNPELLVYGDIGEWWGEVQSREFAEQLQAITSDEIDVRINSNGGSVFTAQAIYSSLKRHPASVNVYIDGIAASAATIIAMAGDKIIMPENTMMMIHSPLVGVYGNADELRDTADILDKVRDTIVAVYRDKSGLDDDKILELMAEDTYLTAAEALDFGLVDEVSPALKIAAHRGKNGTVSVNGLTIDNERYSLLPEDWRASVESQQDSGVTGKKPKQKESVAMTLDELKAQHPDLYADVVAQGVEAERARIQAIEDMVIPGHEALATAAKFETGISAEAFAIELVKAEKATKDDFLNKRKRDASTVRNVVPSSDGGNSDDENRAQAASKMAEAFTARNGRKI